MFGKNKNTENDGNTDIFSKKIKKKLKKKILVVGASILSFFLLFIIIIIICSTLLFNIISFFNGILHPDSYGTNDYISYNEPGTEAYEKEIAYNEELERVSKKYVSTCAITLNKAYINAILFNPYSNLEDFYNNVDIKDIEAIANLMINDCYVDYSIGGSFYKSLKTSSLYDKYIKYTGYSIDDIFNIAEAYTVVTQEDDSEHSQLILSSDLKVDVSVGNYDSPVAIDIKDYILGTVYASFDGEISGNNIELLKALTIAKTTEILLKTGYDNDNKISLVNNATSGILYCDINQGCYMQNYFGIDSLDSGGTSSYNKNYSMHKYIDGKYYYRLPLTDDKKKILNDIISEFFGHILTVDNSIKDVSLQDVKFANSYPNMNYGKILASATGGKYEVSNIGEDNYTSGVVYKNNLVQLNVTFYDQNDYSSTQFCGRNGRTIKTSGCGVVAMAIVASTFADNSYDPVAMMNDAYKWGFCGKNISGTNASFFPKEASKLKINYKRVSANGDLNLVTDSLSSGKSLVIALMGPGDFTSSGHYIVLSGINGSTKEVYVHDPYHKTNVVKRNSGNGWYSFNDIIVKQARTFYIFTKG